MKPFAIKSYEIGVHWKEDVRYLKMALVAAKTAAIALAVNYGVHVSSSLAFDNLCIPHSIWDLAQSVIATASPVCNVLLTTMQLSQNNVAVVLTTSLAATLASTLKP